MTLVPSNPVARGEDLVMDEEQLNQPVVVGVDGSASSVDALRYAMRMASALDAPLHVVSVWSYPPLAEPSMVQAWSPDEDAQDVLDTAVSEAFGDNPPPALVRRIAPGPTTARLIEESKHAQMLVLGSRGHGGFVGLLLGSVSAACAEYAHCPVLIVHSPKQRD